MIAGDRFKSAIVAVLAVLLSVDVSARESQPPNILLILADDLGVNDLGSWGDGVSPTPTLDSLSQQALRFRRHYTDSTCSVSRAALLTGRVPASIGFEPDGLGLSPDLETLPKSLKALGYRTHHVGKWHVGEGIEYPGVWPLRQGFDDWFGMFNHFVLRGPDASGRLVRQAPTFTDPWLQENNLPARQYHGHLDDLLTDRAISLIEQSAGDRPWFINLWLMAPHHPFEPSAEFRQKYPDTDQGRYLALMNQLDNNVGRVLQALERSSQQGNTIVVFSSDNGSPNLGRDSNWPLQGIKTTYLEGGVRAPLLIRWPGHAENRDITSVTHITDLYPTLLSMAGGRVPQRLDGIDLAPVLAGGALADRDLYWAADVKNWGMLYAGHLSGVGGFYRSTFGALESVPVSGARLGGERSVWRTTFSREQASGLIRDWERRVRPVPLNWHSLHGGAAGYLSGRDFQRTPAFGSYSLGLSVYPDGSRQGRPQTLAEQGGVWRLWLDAEGRLRFQHGSNRLAGSAPRWQERCNSLVVSMNIRPASAHPFEAGDEAALSIYLNGESVLESRQVMFRPTSEGVYASPTYIGVSADGTARFSGRLGRPVVLGKYLMPDQDGYRLADMDASLCEKAEWRAPR